MELYPLPDSVYMPYLLQQFRKVGDFIPVEHMSKLKLREIKYLGQSHTT